MTEQAKHKTESRKTSGEHKAARSGESKAKGSEPKAKSGFVRIQWFRSAIAAPVKHKRVVQGLGFTRLNQIIEREDSPSIRGMVNKVPHLVKIVA
jgi:large subunit ribosomal protein L30